MLPHVARIPRSRDATGEVSDDHVRVDALVFRVGVVVLALSLSAWTLLSLVVLVGRVRYERRRPAPSSRKIRAREAERLVRRVSRRPRTEWGRWRRIAALTRLEQAHHPAVPRLI